MDTFQVLITEDDGEYTLTLSDHNSGTKTTFKSSDLNSTDVGAIIKILIGRLKTSYRQVAETIPKP